MLSGRRIIPDDNGIPPLNGLSNRLSKVGIGSPDLEINRLPSVSTNALISLHLEPMIFTEKAWKRNSAFLILPYLESFFPQANSVADPDSWLVVWMGKFIYPSGVPNQALSFCPKNDWKSIRMLVICRLMTLRAGSKILGISLVPMRDLLTISVISESI